MKVNINRLILIATFLCIFQFLLQAQEILSTRSPQNILKVGEKAPPLKIIKWIKGKSIQKFKRGHIYLVDFGFVSCTPCRASIPHLTEVARKYLNKVNLISVHIWENDKNYPSDLTYVKRVERYIKSMGSKIGYTVAVDVPEQTTANTWGGGAPKVFIVNREGIIAWIGDPSEMDTIIDKVIIGTFNSINTSTSQEQEKSHLESQLKVIKKAKVDGDQNTAIKGIDSLIMEYPDKADLYYQKCLILIGSNDSLASVWIRTLLNNNRKEFNYFMYYLSRAILNEKEPNCDLAIAAADRAFENCTYGAVAAWILDAKANGYFKKGAIKRAIEIQEKAVEYMKPFSSELAFKEELKALEVTLENYKKCSKNNHVENY